MATTHNLTLTVDAPEHLSLAEVQALLTQLVSVGQADATESSQDDDLDDDAQQDASEAAALVIGISTEPARVLITVESGVASAAASGHVEVHTLDLDNDPDAATPAEFQNLRV